MTQSIKLKSEKSDLYQMKRVLAIFFLFTFLSANTAFGEVLKLPVLIHHFIEHNQQENGINLFDFLAKHYKGDIHHHHNNSNHDHDNLPFKANLGHSSLVHSFVIQEIFEISNPATVNPDSKITFLKPQFHSNPHLNSIWQPPRSC